MFQNLFAAAPPSVDVAGRLGGDVDETTVMPQELDTKVSPVDVDEMLQKPPPLDSLPHGERLFETTQELAKRIANRSVRRYQCEALVRLEELSCDTGEMKVEKAGETDTVASEIDRRRKELLKNMFSRQGRKVASTLPAARLAEIEQRLRSDPALKLGVGEMEIVRQVSAAKCKAEVRAALQNLRRSAIELSDHHKEIDETVDILKDLG